MTHPHSLFQSARSTVNATELAASRATGTVLVLDELAHMSGKEVESLIYAFASGTGKRRMTADASARNSYSWSTFVVLSSESSLREKIEADDGEWTAGMATRIVDIDVTGVNRRVSADVLAAMGQIDKHFGHAGPIFVQRLIAAGLHRKPDVLRHEILELAKALAGVGADSATLRAALPFAILHMAGELAKKFQVLPDTLDVNAIVQWAFRHFQESNDAVALTPGLQAEANLRTWISERFGSSIHPTTPRYEIRHRDAVGWYDEDAVYIPRERLREAAGTNLKEKQIALHLDAAGHLARREDEKRRYVRYVRGVGHVDCYALRRPEFGRSPVEQVMHPFLGGARA